jgi:hypothetical protein
MSEEGRKRIVKVNVRTFFVCVSEWCSGVVVDEGLNVRETKLSSSLRHGDDVNRCVCETPHGTCGVTAT